MLNEAKEVCPTSTRRLISQGALLLDVRELDEVAACAFEVPALINIPMSELEQRWSELPKDRDIVVVCHIGERSLKATYFLQFHGYSQVSNMGGGLAKWVRKGFPVKGQLTAQAGEAASSFCCAKADDADPRETGCCSH